MIDIESYNILFSNKKIKVIYLWILVTIFIITSVIIITKSINYVNYYQNEGIGTKQDYVKVVVNIADIEKLINKKTVIIGKKNYNYKIINFSEQISQLNGKFYQEIIIDINKKIPTNQRISFKVPIEEYNLFDYLKNKIRGNI